MQQTLVPPHASAVEHSSTSSYRAQRYASQDSHASDQSPVASYPSPAMNNQTIFDPTDYSAQGLDDSAFMGGVAFQMPSFLSLPSGMGGMGLDPSGPAFMAPPAMSMSADKSMMNNFTQSSAFAPSQADQSSLGYGDPVYGMYGSSYIDLQPDSQPFKKMRFGDDVEPSYIQRDGALHQTSDPHWGQSPAGYSPTDMSATSSHNDFDPSGLGLPPPQGGNFPGLYSESGFDLVSVLARVVARPNPIINLGPIDGSASFVVCDARRYDHPIVYASESFSRLTGYSSLETLGRNCRFLQSPTGKVERGEKRTMTDRKAVRHLRKHIASAKESQTSLVNYRKGGEAFINLVTIIPISWDSEEITYFVGFQVNLVDQPNNILSRMRDGSYVINYTLLPQRTEPPAISFGTVEQPAQTPEQEAQARVQRQRQIVQASQRLEKLHGLLGNSNKPVHSVFEDLVEECDDMIHVLSLKGALMYVSPAVETILNYSPQELLGKNLQRICHPSDWIHVQRELKESSMGNEHVVNLLYRIRRKGAGYVWIEAHGRLYTESKGRKYLVLLARERPVYRMSWTDLDAAGGLGDVEFWSKISVDGTYLDVAPSVQRVLGRNADTMLGSRVTSIIPSDQHAAVLDLLKQAAAGKMGSLRHTMVTSIGAQMEVVTNFWPAKPNAKSDGTLGDRVEEATFVVCQTNELGSEIKRLAGPRIGRSTTVAKGAVASASSSASASPVVSMGMQSTFKMMQGHGAARRDNVFNDVDPAHGSSWQFEVHLLENLNRRLREERDALVASKSQRNSGNVLDASTTSRKRRYSDFDAYPLGT